MLDELHVVDVALIRDASISPAAGFSVITGETGAGKTALVGAVKLLGGARADKTLVREGATQAFVEARFVPGDVVVARSVEAGGRSRARINGAMAGVSQLARDVAGWIEVTSQHDTVRLVDEVYQRQLLDGRSGAEGGAAFRAYTDAWDAARDAKSAYDRAAADREASSARVEEARFLLSQVGDILLEQGEYDDIMAALSTAEHSEALARAAKEAYGALAGDGGAMDMLGTAVGALDGASGLDGSLAARAEALREALYAAEDVSRELSGYMEAIDFDAAELERMQEIAAQYQSLMRKWGPTIADVASKVDAARELVESVDGGEEALARFAQAAEAAEGALVDAADALSRVRESVAPRFADDVTAAMSRLCMGSARFECEVVRQPRSAWTRAGADVVQFMYRPAAEMSARPLARIASGGELSRVLLAIYVSASKNNSELEEGFVKSQPDVYGTNDAEALPAAGLDDSVLSEGVHTPSPSDSPTYIFDEIDAGVGGETALALAAELARLAQNRQVIAVTHLAQVAAAADAHFVVEKVEAQGVAQTRIREVVGDERVAELARMLSGRPTDASLAHARELLEAAH